MARSSSAPHLVLVGAGHAHVEVLRAFAMRPPPARLTLVVDQPLAVYSGMVPGWVAGHYRISQLTIDAVPLARAAGARVILRRAVAVDATAQRIELEARPALDYDLASLDIGSSVAGLDRPGVAQHAIATRPISGLMGALERVDRRVAAHGAGARVVVVGGGAAGVELAAALRARLAAAEPRVTLVHAAKQLEPAPGTCARIARALRERGIEVVLGREVVAAEPATVVLDDGQRRPYEVLVWATGSAPHGDFSVVGAARDPRGFVLVRDTLEVVGASGLFAAGDCASLESAAWVPKAGVHAVRQGPVLAANLRARLVGTAPRRYHPQREMLSLLNLGDGTAIGAKWGRALEGRWVMGLKDAIDRRFVERYRLLDPAGGRLAKASAMPSAGSMEMACGGCAAKLGQATLARALGRLPAGLVAPEVELGLAEADDVVAWRTAAGERVVSNVELLRPFGDDPFLLGRVAALNALSDLEAKGVAPRHAQAIVGLPLDCDERAAEELLVEVLAGARSALDAAGAVLLGGHTARTAELLVGFAVDGVAAGETPLPRARGAVAPGELLILTRPLGSGVVLHADMAGRCPGPWLAATLEHLAAGNRAAREVVAERGVRAATDVTGFGLLGHLLPLLGACSARLALSAVPSLPGALELLRAGERSTFHGQNAASLQSTTRGPGIAADDPRVELLVDPQTAGGLLLAVTQTDAPRVIAALHRAGLRQAAVIAAVVARRPGGPPLELAERL